jgi:hypothetical protein
LDTASSTSTAATGAEGHGEHSDTHGAKNQIFHGHATSCSGLLRNVADKADVKFTTAVPHE